MRFGQSRSVRGRCAVACLASTAEPGLVEAVLRRPLRGLGLFHGVVGRIEFGIERGAHRVRIGDASRRGVDDLAESLSGRRRVVERLACLAIVVGGVGA